MVSTSKKNSKESISGEKSRFWKGGRRKDHNGYILIHCPTHPNKIKGSNYVLEHRLIMEKHIGRVLLTTEIVHHVNGRRDDNRIENLMLFAGKKEHHQHHFPKGSLIGKNKREVLP